MSKSGLRCTPAMLLILAGLAACASAPPQGSLESIRVQAAREAMEQCLRLGFTTHRYVPLLALADACDRAVRKRQGTTMVRSR
jgi:hypothetical protein